METDKKKIFLNTLFWGFMLWLFGYILGVVLFFLVPENAIGWVILPFGTLVTLWVLFKKIERESFGCYIGLGVFWALMAVLLDYLFIVKLFGSAEDYYKADVYAYYALTFVLPIVVGWWKMQKNKGQKGS